MPVLEVVDQQNRHVGEISLDDEIFDGRVREQLIHEVVVMQLAARRAGTSAAKTRSEVQGSGTKPWRQKGTGRARAGRRRSPLWRHGGIIFPPRPRRYGFLPPKKVRRAALISALNRKIAEGNIKVVDSLALPETKSRNVEKLLSRLQVRGKVLCVTAGPDPEFRRASWNVPNTKSLPAVGVNVYDVENAQVLVCTRDGLEAVQARFRSKADRAAASAPVEGEGGTEAGS